MKIGIIGSGNMATALLSGFLSSNIVETENVYLSDTDEEKLACWKSKGVNCSTDNNLVAENSNIVIFAVKPNVLPKVLKDIKISESKIYLSIAAGFSIEKIQGFLGDAAKVVRAMPNTPALVNCGMSSLSPNKNIEKNDIDAVKTIFDSFGKSEIVDESLIDVVIGASGSSPAYAFMFIEAMADCAVSYGMKREMAYEFCAQAVMGAAKMLLETKKHPGELKDMVCSPGGTTIEAVKTLENEGMRSAVINGMASCIEKSIEMSK